MSETLVIAFLDGEKIHLNENSFVTLIANHSKLIGEKAGYYSKVIYQNFILNESNVTISAQTGSTMVGIMGVLASSDFFTVSNDILKSDDINSSDAIIYKTSAIKSISFK